MTRRRFAAIPVRTIGLREQNGDQIGHGDLVRHVRSFRGMMKKFRDRLEVLGVNDLILGRELKATGTGNVVPTQRLKEKAGMADYYEGLKGEQVPEERKPAKRQDSGMDVDYDELDG